MMKKQGIGIKGIWALALYLCIYGVLYVNRSPAGNMGYFVYLKGGGKVDSIERVLYTVYFPIYKLHHFLGGGRHNFDRPAPFDAE